MNLYSNKARVPIAALGVTALCTAGLGVLATSASAVGALTLLPSATSATIASVDRTGTTAATQTAAETAYGLKFSGFDSNTVLKAAVTGPVGGSVEVEQIASNGAPDDAAALWRSVNVSATGNVSDPTAVSGTLSNPPVAGDIYYVGSQFPGAYTVQFFQDTNGNGSFDSGVDTAAPSFSLNVKDIGQVGATTSSETTDDLTYSVSATSPIDKGEKSTAKVTLSSLSTSDARGNVASQTYGKLGNELTDLLTTTFSGVAGLSTSPSALAFDGTTYNTTSGSATATGSGGLITAGIGTLSRTAAITVNDNTITGLVYTDTDTTTNVKYTSNTATDVRNGTTSITYKVKATNVTPAAVSGAKVFFRFAAGTNIAVTDITTSAGTPDTDGDVGVNTGSDGVATLTVTIPTAKAVTGNTFSITPRTNGIFIGGGGSAVTNVVTYYATAPATLTANNISAVVGGSATLTGKIVDRWSQPYSSPGVSAAMAITTDAAPGTTTPASGTYPIASDGTFSAVVSETSSNTTPNTDTFSWTVGSVSVTGLSLAWRASITPGTLTTSTITTSGGGAATALPFTSTATTVDVATSGAFTGDVETLKGLLKDSSTSAAVLPFTAVTYTGSDGVLFYDRDNKLVATLTAGTNAAGQLSYDESTDGIRVLFTKTGTATITAVAGAATAANSIPVEAATEAYKVIAQDARSKPGQTVTLLGKVYDAFGNPAVGASVTLALNVSSAGSFSGTDASGGTAGFQVLTDTEGVWSTPFTSTSNQDGTATLTATLTGQTQNATPNAAYAAAGVTIAHGEYQDTAEIQVVDPTTGIAATGILVGGGKAQLSGTAEAGASVDLYSRPAGSSGFTLVKSFNAGDDGMWGIGTTLVKTTSFFARSGGKTSDTVTTVVFSYETIKASALGGGKVRFKVYGTPNVKGVVNIYSGGKRLAHVGTDSHGDVIVTVQSKAGKRTFLVYFVAPGTSLKGKSLTGTVK